MSTEAAGTSLLQVTVVTPEGELWSGAATAVTVPAATGSLGILPRRQPLATELRHGAVTIQTLSGDSVTCTVTGGFVVVDQDEVTVIADGVETPTGR